MAITSIETLKIPYSGQVYPAAEKKFDEYIVFVPFFGGTKKSIKRHIEFVNRLGFDAIAFELKFKILPPKQLPISYDYKFGMKHVWADQIENVLNHIPGQKILFAFSNPSASAIEAIARRNASDVTALICDGGPSGDGLTSIYSYFIHEQPIKFFPLRAAVAAYATLTWSPTYWQVTNSDLIQFPKDFPVLSIRGWKDPLITPQQIDKIFSPHPQLDWKKLDLPECGHLNGLRDFSENYEPAVTQFLTHTSTKKTTN